jgi:hypothetical protein
VAVIAAVVAVATTEIFNLITCYTRLNITSKKNPSLLKDFFI